MPGAGLSFQFATASGGLPAAEQALDAIFDRMWIIQVTSSVLVEARTLVRRHRSGIGLRTLDAIHVASSGEVRTQAGANAIEYITADKRQHVAFTTEGPGNPTFMSAPGSPQTGTSAKTRTGDGESMD